MTIFSPDRPYKINDPSNEDPQAPNQVTVIPNLAQPIGEPTVVGNVFQDVKVRNRKSP